MLPPLLRGPARTRGLAAALLAAVCVATAAGTATAATQAPAQAQRAGAATARTVGGAAGARVVDIVAHPDDDLFFMNPDVQQAVSDGVPVTTVYLTSGESDGVNASAQEAKTLQQEGRPPVADRAAYSEARQNGIRAAYALMATGNRTSAWRRTSVPTAGGGRAEVDVLIAKPSVQLVWLEMKEAESVSGSTPVSLHGLWDGATSRLPSMLTSGTPVTTAFSYTKSQVVDTLVGVLKQYRPTLVGTQDPTPGKYPNADHQDHVYGARFVQAALARYAAAVPFGQRPHFTVQNYLGYQTDNFPEVLDTAAADAKLAPLAAYAWTDGGDYCGSPAGCGDLKVKGNTGEDHWADDIRYARGDSTSWLATGPDGTPWAFSVLDGQMAVWHQAGGSGTSWTGPQLLPGTGLDQGAEAVTLPDGRIAVFATRTNLGATAAGYHREVVYAVERAPGSDAFAPWKSLGAPSTDNTDGTLDFSAPAVAVAPDGRLSVYVRDGNYTLRGRTQSADGSWAPWQALGGSGLNGDPVAATAADGTRYVFAATVNSVTGWSSAGPDGAVGPAVATGLPPTTLPLTAAPSGDGVRLWFRKPVSGDILTAQATAGPGGLRLSSVSNAGDAGGYGPAAACADTVAGRTADGDLGATSGGAGAWHTDTVPFTGGPAGICRAAGPVVGVIGWDAALHVLPGSRADGAQAPPGARG